jgi:hypothetical protein
LPEGREWQIHHASARPAMKATCIRLISGLLRLPLPIFRNRRLALPNGLREGKLRVIVISAAMPNDRDPPNTDKLRCDLRLPHITWMTLWS